MTVGDVAINFISFVMLSTVIAAPARVVGETVGWFGQQLESLGDFSIVSGDHSDPIKSDFVIAVDGLSDKVCWV